MHEPVVLGYAPRQDVSKAMRLARVVLLPTLLLLLGMALGAALGRALTPVTFVGHALYQVPFPGGGTVRIPQAQFDAALQAHGVQMLSPAVLDTIAADLRTRGQPVPGGPAGRAFITRRLELRQIQNSLLTQVVFYADDPALAGDAADAVAAAATGLTVNGGSPTIFAGRTTSPRRDRLGAWIGAVAGVTIAGTVLALRWRRARRQAATRL